MAFTCKECNWQWNPRHVHDVPVWCPNCHTLYWQKERTEKRGITSRSSPKNKPYPYDRSDHHIKWAINAIQSHNKRGNKINISMEELAEMARNTTICQICGENLKYCGVGSGENAKPATMDRILNGNSYTIKEVGILCRRCNTLKGNIGFERFKQVTTGFVNYIRKVEPGFSIEKS